jgi:Na+/proline symporter
MRRSARRSGWLWLLLIVMVVLLLGLIFGGYRKGTKVGAPEPTAHAHPVVAASSVPVRDVTAA